MPTTKRAHSCYDCGSTIKGHHTPSCDMAPARSKRDLPEIPGTQYWTEAGGQTATAWRAAGRPATGIRVPPVSKSPKTKPNIQRLLDAVNAFNNETRLAMNEHWRSPKVYNEKFEAARTKLKSDLNDFGIGDSFDYSEE